LARRLCSAEKIEPRGHETAEGCPSCSGNGLALCIMNGDHSYPHTGALM
jgi:hypothetical protein